MKNVVFSILLCLPLCGAAQNIAEESELQKSTFNASEPIPVKGLAANYSWADSVSYCVVPTGANNNMRFVLRNLTTGVEYWFEDFDLVRNRAQVLGVWKTIPGTWNTFQGKIAGPGAIEVFSFDIRQLDNWPIWNRNTKDGMPRKIRIHLTPGKYEFGWTSALSNYFIRDGSPAGFEKQEPGVLPVQFEILE
ncbi:MAG: hypothetical protein IPJ82_21785 [Lewinellaceae bacterium]|nr:hypothetical protein [Lewinellaceae bacterium]